MKYYKCIIIILAILGLMLHTACSDLKDTYKDYIDGGEIIYSTKVDSVLYFSGDERMEIKGYLRNAMQVKNIIIQWSNQDKTVETRKISYDYQTMLDTFSTVLQVTEGQYIFTFTTENEQGDTSIPYQKGTKVYGPQYKSYLTNRTISSILPSSTGGAKITFGNVATNMVITKVTYQSVSGVTETVSVLPSDGYLMLIDCDFSVPSSYISGYLPETMAIDTLYCAATELDFSSLTEVFTLDQTDFSIASYSSQETPANEGGGNGPAANIIDGNVSSYWQSEWDAQTAQLPHQITVDMKYAWNVFSIQLQRRTNNNHTKTVVLEGSLDGSTWTPIGTLNYTSSASENSQTRDIQDGQRVRYIRINVTESNTPPYASLAELIVKGKL